ncbi:hypothetical protein PQX77_017375 [Marasmius sp. AFHP31]|nr:hypothetical protein PQX77_017375 [Marasmius sp. AFHP31]
MLRKSAKITGIEIPRIAHHVKETLFADDTAVALHHSSSWEDLWEVLNTWTAASSGKFNIPKTEVIPIGSVEYRNTLLTTRKLNEEDAPIPGHIRIIPDGQSARYLGARVGNHYSDSDPWLPIIEKIESKLQNCLLVHPTLNDKVRITESVIGARTQFAAKANGGMPEDITKRLIRIQGNFVNAHISRETLQAFKKEGGKQFFDLRLRNTALGLTQFKGYLTFGENRPVWAQLTDELYSLRCVRSSTSVYESRVNPFLQTWKPSSRNLPRAVENMFKSANKAGVTFNLLTPTEEVRRDLPLFHHFARSTSQREAYNTEGCKCLRLRHGVTLVGDAVDIAARINNTDHTRNKDCTCPACDSDRTIVQCDNPHRCAETAKTKLNELPNKWNPTSSWKPVAHVELNDITRVDDKDTILDIFPAHPSVTNGFRIFTKDEKGGLTIALNRTTSTQTHTTLVWCAGRCKNRQSTEARAGSGVWFAHEDIRNLAIPVPSRYNQTPRNAEVLAIIEAAKATPKNQVLCCILQTEATARSLAKNLLAWERRNFAGVDDADLLRSLLVELRKREHATILRDTRVTHSPEAQTAVDELAERATNTLGPEARATPPSHHLTLYGAELSVMTQSLAYRILREKAPRPERKGTDSMIVKIQQGLRTLNGWTPLRENIWKNINHKDFSRRSRNFLYLAAHGAVKTGRYWKHFMPERINCGSCETEESVEHILTQCSQTWKRGVWDFAKSLWPKDYGRWPNITIGTVIGCGMVQIKNLESKKRIPGAERLYRILISECAHLIWKIRCEIVIRGKNEPSVREAQNRIRQTINGRLQRDILLARRLKGTKQKMSQSVNILTQTWVDVLDAPGDTRSAEEWMDNRTGFLVGIEQVKTNDDEPRATGVG